MYFYNKKKEVWITHLPNKEKQCGPCHGTRFFLTDLSLNRKTYEVMLYAHLSHIPSWLYLYFLLYCYVCYIILVFYCFLPVLKDSKNATSRNCVLLPFFFFDTLVCLDYILKVAIGYFIVAPYYIHAILPLQQSTSTRN